MHKFSHAVNASQLYIN